MVLQKKITIEVIRSEWIKEIESLTKNQFSKKKKSEKGRL